MKKGWKVEKLGDVCEIFNGGTPDTKVPKYWGGSILWITPKDMGKLESIYVDDTARKITDEGLKNSSARILPPNSVILSSRAPIGHLAINTKEMTTNQGCKGIVPKKELSTLFLYYFLENSVELLNSLGSGTTFKELSASKLAEVAIPIPPLPEQQRIVSLLDETFAGLAQVHANAERNLVNAREVFEAALKQELSTLRDNWEEKRLEELGQITSSKRIYKNEYVNDGIPFYRIKEVKELANDKEISVELFIARKRYQEIKEVFGVPQKGDLLMTAVGTIGEIYVISDDEEFYFKDGNVLWFKDFNSVDPFFLKYALRVFVEEIQKLSVGAAYKALTIEKVEKHKIFIPPLEEQRAIVQRLDALAAETSRLEAVYQSKLEAVDELKKSVLGKAFEGEL